MRCRFIASRGQEVLGDLAGKSVEALGLVNGLGKRQLVQVDVDKPTLLCLERMKVRAHLCTSMWDNPRWCGTC